MYFMFASINNIVTFSLQFQALTEYDRDSICSSCTVLSSVDWDQVDELLDNQ